MATKQGITLKGGDRNASRQIDKQTVEILINHGLRKGFLTRADIFDCIPDAEFDESLFDELLEMVGEAGIQYLEDGDPSQEPEEEYNGEDQGIEAGDADDKNDLAGIDTDDMVRLYVREAARVPLLSAEEEVDLAQRIELCRLAQVELGRGKVTPKRTRELRRLVEDGRIARERLIRANARLVISVAKKYTGHGLPFLDLIQEGNLGLMRAIRSFDYRRGFKFSTYATWWIRRAVTRALAEQSRTIRLPVHMSDQVSRLARQQNKLQQTLGRAPTTEELAAALGVAPRKVEQLLEVVRHPVSLQSPVGEDDDDALGDFIEDVDAPNPEETVSQALTNADLMKQLDKLPPRELEVIRLRYGLTGEDPMTFQKIGNKLGITRERARQLEAQALNHLRHPEIKRKRSAYVEKPGS